MLPDERARTAIGFLRGAVGFCGVSVELPAAPTGAGLPPYRAGVAPARASRELLSWASLGYTGVEGAVAIAAGLLAASPALIGFGIDSAIEGLPLIFASAARSGG